MEEIKIGDFIRTKSGKIYKIDKIDKCPICKEKEYINKEIIGDLHFENTYHKKDILNHSSNIIDLIEVGDYVNGEIVIKIFNPLMLSLGELPYVITSSYVSYEPQEIKTIVTKEMFQQAEYRLED